MTTTAPAPADSLFDARDFRIGDINLIGSDGVTLDIRGIVVELQVRQDIYTGYMHGEAVIVDASDVISKTSMHGSEYLYLNLTQPGSDVQIRKAFRIFKISDRGSGSNQTQHYILHFVSDEMLESNTKRISKAYKGSRISDIVVDILTTYLNVEDYNVEQTSEPVDIIIPGYRPTEAINWLASRAFNGNDKFCYLFYENLDGFNFRSLHSMYEDGPLNEDVFMSQQKVADRQISVDRFTFDSFSITREFDSLVASGSGAYAMKLTGIDPFHQRFYTTDYNIGNIPKLYENPAISNMVDNRGDLLFDKSDAYQLTYLQTNDTPTEKSNRSEVWVKRVMCLAALRNSLMELVIPGNLTIQAGKLVALQFPHMIPPTKKESMKDEMKSSNYFVIAVTHKFDIPTSQVTTSFSVCRDSEPVVLTNTDPQLPKKIASMNRGIYKK